MRIATWNVNSLRVRLDQLLAWLPTQQPDIVGLQETKLIDAQSPVAAISAAGYYPLHAGQKTYNGVALYSRQPPEGEPVMEIPGFPDPQRRVLAATYPYAGEALRVINLYVPNGQTVGSDKYLYKLAWLAGLTDWLREELARYPQLVVMGDFNIAPEARDLHDPAAWEGSVLCSAPERAAFQGLLALGLQDSFRLFDQPAGSYSWWDYRMGAFRRNHGVRIDHILVSAPLANRCTQVVIDRTPRGEPRPSDHAPVVAEFDGP